MGRTCTRSNNCYGSVISSPQKYNPDTLTNPNAGRFFGQVVSPGLLGPKDNPIFRRMTFSDPEQYKKGFAQVRTDWRLRQSLYNEWLVRLTIQGHSMPGPDGKWRPLVEGNVAELSSTRLSQYGRYMIEQVHKRQNASVGTECDVVLRKLGLLGI